MNRRLVLFVLMVAALSSARCQEAIQGRVCDGGTKQGIPYAAVHVVNTCVGTYCNEAGQFALHIPQGMKDTKVVISSLGYSSDTIEARQLAKRKGKVVLEPNVRQLRPVEVVEYGSARKLLEEVFRRIPENYRVEDAVGIWQYRNRQMLNDSLFVKSEGLMRMYMQPYNGKPLKAHHGPNSSQWDEELYRLYQRLDTVLVYNKAYWRSLIGSDSLDRMMLVDRFSKPSDCWRAALTDIVFGGKKTRNLILSKKSKFVMETFSQDGKGYYRVTATIPVKLLDTCYTAVFVITKDELAIVDAVCEIPRFTYKPKIYFTSHPYCEDEQSASRTHYCYHKYNGRYQLDFVQYEYEYWYKFTLEAKERGCRSTRLKISGKEECILAEHTYEGVAEYKRRYVDNEHPRTEENVRETERILRQPHNKIPW